MALAPAPLEKEVQAPAPDAARNLLAAALYAVAVPDPDFMHAGHALWSQV